MVPFLVAASVLMLQYLNARTSARDPERMLPGDWIRRGTTRNERIVELRGLAGQRPPGMEVVVLGADGTVEFSTIPGFEAGGSVDAVAVLEYLRENDQATLYRPREPPQSAAIGRGRDLRAPVPRAPAAPGGRGPDADQGVPQPGAGEPDLPRDRPAAVRLGLFLLDRAGVQPLGTQARDRDPPGRGRGPGLQPPRARQRRGRLAHPFVRPHAPFIWSRNPPGAPGSSWASRTTCARRSP